MSQAVQQTPSGQHVTDTNNGFIVGVDPATPPQGGIIADSAVAQSQDQGITSPAQPVQHVDSLPTLDAQPPQGFFTAEDIERVRSEEKAKLYGRIEEMGQTMQQLREEQERRAAEEEAERQRIEEEARRKEEEALDVRELLERREQEFNERFERIEQERAAERALFERERELAALDDYRRAIVEASSDEIMPELRDLIGGNSKEEIDASVEAMRARTAAIMQNISDVAQQQRQSMRGVTPVGAPPVGPMEQASSYENLTAEQISNMSMDEYRQHRDRLLRAASPNFRG
jgi:hypothetical protein